MTTKDKRGGKAKGLSSVPLPPDRSYTINEFCAAERQSRAKFYDDLKNGRGPRIYRNGTQIRITHQARLDWQRQREAEATPREVSR
jgi:hypothetical protein